MAGSYIGDQLGDLPDLLPEGGLVLLRAPLGSGKSQWCKRQAMAHAKVIAITDSTALTGAVAKDFDLELYSEIKNDDAPARLATTVHSVARFDPINYDTMRGNLASVSNEPRWDLAIIDEAPAVRATLHDPTRKVAAPQATKEHLLAHMAAAKWTIVTSADLSESEAAWYEAAYLRRNPGAQVLRIRRAPLSGQRTIELYSPARLESDLLSDIRDHVRGSAPLVILSTSTQYPHELAQTIHTLRPDLRVWWVSSDNSKLAAIREALSDPDSILDNYDIIVVSPTVKNGLSWTRPVRRVYARFTGAELSSTGLAQMIMRCRNPIDTTIRCCLTARTGEWDCDPTYLERVALGLAERTSKTVDRTMLSYDLDYRTGQRKAHDPEMLASWVMSEQERRINANDSVRECVRTFASHGWDVVDARDYADPRTEKEKEADNAKKAEARETIAARYSEAILAAPSVDDDEGQRLAGLHTLTSDEQATLRRHEIESFYGRQADQELIEADKRGKHRRVVRDYVRLRAWQYGVRAPAVLADRHATDATEHRHTALRMQLLDRIIRAALGTSLDQAHGLSFTSQDLADKIGPMLEDPAFRRQVREILRSSCTASSAESPTQWLCALLRRSGAEITHKAKRVNAKQVRTYTIDLTTIRDLAKAEHSRMLHLLADMRGSTSRYAPDCDYMLTPEQAAPMLDELTSDTTVTPRPITEAVRRVDDIPADQLSFATAQQILLLALAA